MALHVRQRLASVSVRQVGKGNSATDRAAIIPMVYNVARDALAKMEPLVTRRMVSLLICSLSFTTCSLRPINM